MNKKIQGIIVGGVVVAALGGTLAFLELTGKDPKDGTSSDTSSAAVKVDTDKDPVAIISTDPSNIKELRVENEHGGFVLERPASGKTEFNIKELSGIVQDSSYKSSTVNDISKLEAYKLVEENASDLEKYGLTKPRIKFTVVFGDDSETTYLIGGDDVNKQRYCYFCEDGKSDVYMVLKSRMSGVFSRKEDFVTKALTSIELGNEGEYGKLTVKRRDLDYDMVFEQAHENKGMIVSAQVMVEPLYASLNITKSADITHGIAALNAQSCEMIYPEEKDFKTYGLDDPLAEVIYEENGKVYNLKIGDPIYLKNENGEDTREVEAYYGYLTATGMTGMDCIWRIRADNAKWASFTPGEVIAMITSNEIFDLSELKITTENQSYDFTLSADGDSKIHWVRKNGVLLEDDDPFRMLYLYILSFPPKEVYLKETEGDPFITIEIIRADGGKDKLEFIKDVESERRVIIKLNGKTSYRVESKWTDEFIVNLGRLERGEELTSSPA